MERIYEFADFRLVPGEGLLLRNGQPIALNPKAFAVLVLLVERNGHLVVKSEIIDTIWEDAFVEEGAISKSIWFVRNALGDASKEKFIQTVPRRGYRFVAPVKVLNDPAHAPSGHNDISGAYRLPIVPESVSATEAMKANGLAEDAGVQDETAASRSKKVERRSFSRRSLAAYVGVAAIVIGGLLVANNWRLAQTPSQDPSPANGQDNHTRAYDLYVRGKVKAGIESREETEAAIKLLEEAVTLAPNSAEAYAQLARVYNTKAFKYSWGEERKQFYENAEVAIEKALTLNPDLAEAHFARGLVLWNNTKGFPHEQAIRSYKRSLKLDPRQDETHHQLSMVYAHIGLFDEAKQSIDNALALNPNNTMARFRAGNYLAWQGKFEEALSVLRTVPSDVSPLLVERIKAEALIQTGRDDEARAIVDDYLNRYPDDDGGSFTSVGALLLAKVGKWEAAEDAIKRSVEIGKGFGHFHHTEYNIASTYALMNNPEEAVKWLENAAENGFPNYTYFAVDPNLNNIRQDGRFIEFMKKLERQRDIYKGLV